MMMNNEFTCAGLLRNMATLGLALGLVAAPVYALPQDLGTAKDFAVLANTTITNTNLSVVSGNLGVSPNTAITGFFGTVENDGPGTFIGTAHQADAVALQAQLDARTAYVALAGLGGAQDLTGQDLGLQPVLSPGVYSFTSTAQLTGTLTLDGGGQENPLFVFQIGTALTTASDSVIALINGADACNIFFVVGSAATLGTDTLFNGNIIADTESITLDSRAAVNGRLISLGAAVTLDHNIITATHCLEPGTPGILVADDDGITVPDNGPATLINSTDLGTFNLDDLAQQIFTITNPGDEPLLLGGLSITGDFALVGSFPQSIAAGASIDFTLGMDTTTLGLHTGSVTFETNAPDTSYTFAVQGNVVIRAANAAIPEPSSLLMLLTGMFALAQRKRSAAAAC